MKKTVPSKGGNRAKAVDVAPRLLTRRGSGLGLAPAPPRFWGPSTCVSTLPTDHY